MKTFATIPYSFVIKTLSYPTSEGSLIDLIRDIYKILTASITVDEHGDKILIRHGKFAIILTGQTHTALGQNELVLAVRQKLKVTATHQRPQASKN